MKLAVVILMLGLANAAAAEPAKIFQLSAPTSLPKAQKLAPEKLTQVLAQALGAQVSIVPIEDAADMVGCKLTVRACLEEIARSAKVERIIFGHLVSRDDGIAIKLTLFEIGKGETLKNFTLVGDTTDELVTALENKLDAGKEKDPPPTKREEPVVPVAVVSSSGGVSTSTWAMIVGGGIAIGAGIAALVSANSIGRQVAAAPTETRQDIDQLIVLERAGKRRMELGAGLLAAGGLVATIGIVRMVIHKRSQPEKPMLDVVPEKGGATVMFRMGW